MNLVEYQAKASTFKKYKDEVRIIYPALGLGGEAGEVLNEIKKIYRDDNNKLTTSRLNKIKDEIGDVLWYASTLCSDLGISLDSVAIDNIQKLRERHGVEGELNI